MTRPAGGAASWNYSSEPGSGISSLDREVGSLLAQKHGLECTEAPPVPLAFALWVAPG